MIGCFESFCLLLEHSDGFFSLLVRYIFAFLLSFLFVAKVVNQSAVMFVFILKSKQPMLALLQLNLQLFSLHSKFLCCHVPDLQLCL